MSLPTNPNLIMGGGTSPYYNVQRSLRFRASASAYLNRTPGSAGNRQTWTMSFWVKRGSLSSSQIFVSAGTSGVFYLQFQANDTLRVRGATVDINTTAVFRDPSAWYSVVIVWDSANATQANRLIVYVNGISQALTTVAGVALNETSEWNSTSAHNIGRYSFNGTLYFDGYLTEFNFIDGQALDPSYFGYTDPVAGVWMPKRYMGTYGNNGFYLPFKNNSSLDGIAYDYSTTGYAVTNRQGTAAAYYINYSTTYAAASTAFTESVAASYNLCVGVQGSVALSWALGKDWGAGVTKTITAFNAIGSIIDGIGLNSGTSTLTVKLQGSNDNSTWTDLYTSSALPAATQRLSVTNGITTTNAYRYHRVLLTENSNPGISHVCVIGCLELFEAGDAGQNNWYTNNISLTSGVTYDSMLDVPTNWGDGGNGRGNYCVLNPLDKNTITVSDANLSASYGSAAWYMVRGTVAISTGKWYWEITATSASSHCVGIATASASLSGVLGGDASGWGYWQAGYKYNSGSPIAYGATWTTNDVIGIAFDADAGTLTFYKNNTSQGTAYSGLSANVYFPAVSENAGSSVINFGQRPFAYTPPSGFKALNTLNLPMPTILNGAKYMAATIYAGNGTTQTISNGTNSGNNFLGTTFQPDFVWVKNRTGAYDNILSNSISGANLSLYSNRTLSEQTNNSGGYINSFNATGFSPITGSTNALDTNATSNNYVAWQWNAGSGVTSSNTSGTVTSTVSANVMAGFSVVTWTGTGATNATVGHGLSVLPNMVIIKKRNVVENWYVAHTGSGQGINFAYHLFLNTTGALSGNNDPYLMGTQISTTSNVLALADGTSNNGGNQSGTKYVAYCFAGVAGYSKFGSYTGNGSADGPFVYCGFRPRWIMVKLASGVENWYIEDSTRGNYNANTYGLFPNLANAEQNSTSYNVDFLSNGFKIRTADASFNSSSGTYIYAAFAENPFNVSRAR